MSGTGLDIGFPIDSPSLLPRANASPEIFFQHLQASCQCLLGKSALSSACRCNFPACVNSTVPANGMVSFQGDWVIINFLVQELYSLCKPKMLKAGWETRKMPFNYSASAFLVSNSTIQRLSETSVLHENIDHAISASNFFL